MEATFIMLGILVIGVGFLAFRAYLRMRKIKQIPESGNIRTLTDQNFSHQIKNGLVLVDFWAAWCMPCRMMVPVLNELADDPDIHAVVAKLNVDEARGTASHHAIRSIPTTILFRNGKEVERMVGVKTADQLRRTIGKYAIHKPKN